MFGLKKMSSDINALLAAQKKTNEAATDLAVRICMLETKVADLLKAKEKKKPGRKPKSDARKS